MPRLSRILVLASLAALAATSMLGGSAAGTSHYATGVKIRKQFPTFHGQVFSDSDFCRDGRKVQLMKKRVGHPPRVLGVDHAKLNGHWKVEIAAGSGAYFAKVPAYGSASLGIQCGAAVSRTLVID